MMALRQKWGYEMSNTVTISDRRKQTMLERIGEAADLIDDLRYLPFYRSVQIKLEKLGKADEWGKIISLAKSKENASRYFAKLCKMIRDGSYKYAEKVKAVAGHIALDLSDKLVRFGFGKYQKFYVRKAAEMISVYGMAGLVELLEFAERKGLSQKYVARALINGKPPREYYDKNIRGKS